MKLFINFPRQAINLIVRKSLSWQTILLIMLSSLPRLASAQSSLNDYIREGLTTNESIRQQNFQLAKSLYALQEAKSLFGPTVAFEANYTRAAGGRSFEIPIGDLLNQAYATLNRLTGTNKFPQLQNQSILFNPDNFYDAKFHTSLPLLDAALLYNKRIKGQQVDLQKMEVNLYKRELVREIKNAWYEFAKAFKAVSIYETSLQLAEENRRINVALFNNQKVNRTVVVRSENEVTRIKAQIVNAQQSLQSARAYFNFLLNRNLTDSVRIDSITALPQAASMEDTSVENREELAKMRIARGIDENQLGLARSYLVPAFGTFLDLGAQDFNWKLTSSSRYYFFGVSLNWNLFASGKNTYVKKQAIADLQSLEAENKYVEEQLRMQLSIAKDAYRGAVANYDAAQSQLLTSDQYYRDELKLYKEGQALYIELLDAQNQLIDARLQSNIALFDAWSRWADIERANASFNLNETLH